jgi:hypothetical protein
LRVIRGPIHARFFKSLIALKHRSDYTCGHADVIEIDDVIRAQIEGLGRFIDKRQQNAFICSRPCHLDEFQRWGTQTDVAWQRSAV